MKRFVAQTEWVVERTSYWLAHLAVVSLLLLTVVVTYSVIMRYAFRTSLDWTDELASYCLLWSVFFGLAYTLNVEAHIRVDFFTQMLSPAPRYYLEVAVWAIGVLFALLLVLGSLSAVENFIRRDTYSSAGLDIPLYLPALPLLLGSVVFMFAMAARLLRLVVIGMPTQDESPV